MDEHAYEESHGLLAQELEHREVEFMLRVFRLDFVRLRVVVRTPSSMSRLYMNVIRVYLGFTSR